MTQMRYDFINGTDATVHITITLNPMYIPGSVVGTSKPNTVEVLWCDPAKDKTKAYETSKGTMGPVFLLDVPAGQIMGFVIDGSASWDQLPTNVSERPASKKDPWPPPPPPPSTKAYGSNDEFLARYYAFNRGGGAGDEVIPYVIERQTVQITRVTYVAVPVKGYGAPDDGTP